MMNNRGGASIIFVIAAGVSMGMVYYSGLYETMVKTKSLATTLNQHSSFYGSEIIALHAKAVPSPSPGPKAISDPTVARAVHYSRSMEIKTGATMVCGTTKTQDRLYETCVEK